MACVAAGCKSRSGAITEHNAQSFHRFPKEPRLKNKWLKNLKRPDWTPTVNSRLCNLHFEPSCFRHGTERIHLHSYAVPTIFPCRLPQKSKRITKKRKHIESQKTTTTPKTENNIDPPKKRSRLVSQRDEVAARGSRKKNFTYFKHLVHEKNRKLKNTRRKNYRLLQKTTNLENTITQMQIKMEGEHTCILKKSF